jgi:hypothetical protein
VNELLNEARRMPDASIRLAKDVSYVQTRQHLIQFRTDVRTKHRASLLALHAAINERFGTTGAASDYVNVFYAASEMALMERVGRDSLSPVDRRTLRRLWEHLLHAR